MNEDIILATSGIVFIIGLYGGEPAAVLGAFSLVMFWGLIRAIRKEGQQ